MLKSKFKKINIDHIISNYLKFIVGVLLVAISFNLFLLPLKVVFGVSGVSVILNNVYGFDPSLTILIISGFLIILSYLLLGKEDTKRTVFGTILYPIFVKLTSNIGTLIDIQTSETLILVLFGAVITGLGLGLTFKSKYTTGGTDILDHIMAKYFKISVGNAMLIVNGLIIASGVFVFGWTKLLYSLLTLYIISIITDKVLLGISQSKTFFVITEHETAVKRFITNELKHGVTVFEARGGYTGNKEKVIMCTIPTNKYFKFKEGISNIDKRAFVLAIDAYEVSGGA